MYSTLSCSFGISWCCKAFGFRWWPRYKLSILEDEIMLIRISGFLLAAELECVEDLVVGSYNCWTSFVRLLWL